MKLALTALAIALANIVLPQPGGPYSKTPPLWISKFNYLNLFCCLIGIIIYLSNYCLRCLRPPISSRVVVGISVKPSFLRMGWTNLREVINSYADKVGSIWFCCSACKPASLISITKSAAMNPDVAAAISDICNSLILLWVFANNFVSICFRA